MCALLAVCAATLSACAAPSGLALHLASKHMGGPPERAQDNLGASPGPVAFNEVNPGLGLAWEVAPRLEVEAGAFENSFADLAPYGGLNWTVLERRQARAGLALAAAHYRHGAAQELQPIGGPWLELHLAGPAWARLLVAPGAAGAGGLVALGLRFRLRP